MDRKLFAEYFGEHRAILPLPGNKERVMFVDSCGGHDATTDSDAVVKTIRTTFRYLPLNSTHLTQPCDIFHNSETGRRMAKRWDAEKVKMVQEGK
jgi:hypothetical protein